MRSLRGSMRPDGPANQPDCHGHSVAQCADYVNPPFAVWSALQWQMGLVFSALGSSFSSGLDPRLENLEADGVSLTMLPIPVAEYNMLSRSGIRLRSAF